MKAIILAAGRGSRMKDLTADQPKCLVEVGGKSLLNWQMDAIRGAGIEEIGIVTGYQRELLPLDNVTEFHNAEWKITNMVSSLCCAQEWLRTEPCIVSYSDIFYHDDAIRLLVHAGAKIAITFDPYWKKLWEKRFGNPLIDAETFRLDKNGNLREIGNKPRTMDEIEGQYMGLLRFTPPGWNDFQRIWSNLKKNERQNIHITAMLQKIINAKAVNILPLPYFGNWGEIDSQEDLEIYNTKGWFC
tara:strand:- start:56 stop:787 length:732 start_codon:yes stop_codon:yes gene_type:complete